MAEFNPINTEEEFAAAVRERYGDVENLQGQITTLTGERDAHAATIADLQNQVAGYQTAELKAKIAKEFGIPANMAGRLSGKDEQAMRADAKDLAAQLDAHKGRDPGKDKEKGGSEGGNGLLAMLRNMKGA